MQDVLSPQEKNVECGDDHVLQPTSEECAVRDLVSPVPGEV